MGELSPLTFGFNIDRYVVNLAIWLFLFLKDLSVCSKLILLSDYLCFLLMQFNTTCPLMVLFPFIFCVQNSLKNLLYWWLGGHILF
jgi:hypothetical protein